MTQQPRVAACQVNRSAWTSSAFPSQPVQTPTSHKQPVIPEFVIRPVARGSRRHLNGTKPDCHRRRFETVAQAVVPATGEPMAGEHCTRFTERGGRAGADGVGHTFNLKTWSCRQSSHACKKELLSTPIPVFMAPFIRIKSECC